MVKKLQGIVTLLCFFAFSGCATTSKIEENEELAEIIVEISGDEAMLDVVMKELAATLDKAANKEEHTELSGAADLTYQLREIRYDSEKNQLIYEIVTPTQDLRLTPHRLQKAVCSEPVYLAILNNSDVAIVHSVYFNNIKEGDIAVTDC